MTRPLTVDLDGTLLKTDSMDEALRHLLLHKPFELIRLMVLKLLVSRAAFKWELYSQVELGAMPFNEELVTWLRAQKAQGRTLVLVSATPQFYVEKIGKRLGDLFEVFIGSTPTENRKAKKKAAHLVSLYGEKGFDYVGNSGADIAVWKRSHAAYNVSGCPRLKAQATLRGVTELTQLASFTQDTQEAYVQALRPRQWLKNLLIFIPLLAAHRWTDVNAYIILSGLFVVLCSLASAGYLWNDFLDLEADRANPEKKNRPMASGALSVMAGLSMAVGLAVFGAVASFVLFGNWGWAIVGYLCLSVLYSSVLKLVTFVDVLTLAGLYVYRMALGGWVVGSFISPWLAVSALLFFLQLALLKRASGLISSGELPRWPYKLGSIPALKYAAILLAVVTPAVVALYALVEAPHSALYSHPLWLLGLPAIFAVWQLRCVAKLQVGQLRDPLRFAVHDLYSYILVFAAIAFILLAR